MIPWTQSACSFAWVDAKEGPTLKAKTYQVLTSHEQQKMDVALARIELDLPSDDLGKDSQEHVGQKEGRVLPIMDQSSSSRQPEMDFGKGLIAEPKPRSPERMLLTWMNAWCAWRKPRGFFRQSQGASKEGGPNQIC